MYHGERLNTFSHLIGAIAAVVGMVVLLVSAAVKTSAIAVVSVSVYGSTLVFLYTASTLYHSVKGRLKPLFQKIDHLAIYGLIAGTYTPFTLITLQGPSGWTLFGVVWGLAVLGMVIEFLPFDRKRILPVIIYLVMGWSIVFTLEPLLAALPKTGIWGLVAGGVTYTLGVIFYAFGDRIPHGHGIWHFFVLGGSLFHYFTILFFVL